VARALAVRVVAGPDLGQECRATGDTLSIGTAEGNDLVLSDPTVSRYHCELSQEAGRIHIRDNGSTNGIEAGGVLVVSGQVMPGTVLRVGRSKLRVEDAGDVTLDTVDDVQLAGLAGRSAVMRRLMADIKSAARVQASVLLQGETGTGKELVSRAIHTLSPRASAALEIVDCGTLMPSLIASDLFGHEKGAFTGAETTKQGAFERANGGTIFLDEVGELPETLQPTLLGVIERRTIRRVGGSKLIPIDVRIIAATHRDLKADVNAGRFRQDLYFRLAVLKPRIPPLRERLEDLPLLIDHFLREAGYDGPTEAIVSAEAMALLRTHQWPGNVRELRNFVEVSLAMGEPPEVELAPGAAAAAEPSSSAQPSEFYERPFRQAQAAFERAYVEHLMERVGGNVSKGARVAAINRSFLRLILARHGLGR